MIIDAFKKVSDMASNQLALPLGVPSFRPQDRYKAFPLDSSNFHPITPTSGTSAFLDGGNLEILSTPALSVHFERVYYNLFRDGERAFLSLPQKIEFLAVVSARGSADGFSYEASLLPLSDDSAEYLPRERDLRFDAYDRSISERGMVRISSIGGIIRSFAEWSYAASVCDELDDGIFVMDGTLHAPYKNEAKYAQRAYKSAHGVIFCGVSKTSHLYTTTGLSLPFAIRRLAREKEVQPPWYYSNLVEITDPAHLADLNFAMLHKDSRYVFRVEVLKTQRDRRDEALSLLAGNSNDLTFPGYPYGLIDAHKHAHVPQDLLGRLRTLLLSQISSSVDSDSIADLLSTTDAHDYLDRIV